MIPVLGLLVCGYILIRMVEIATAKERPSGFVEVLALLMIFASLAAALYFVAVGGFLDRPATGQFSPNGSEIMTDTTMPPFQVPIAGDRP